MTDGYKIKRILTWVNGEEKVIRPPIKPRTFTISWKEKSNMSSGWTYSDDAAGLTAGSTDFDEFFGYYGCRLNSAGVETAKVEQSSPGILDITQLGTLTSGDNVMIAFPVRGIKMTKSGSTVTLSITDDPNKTSEGFQYYAHSKGQINNITGTSDAFYLGAYEGYNNSGVLKSWSGKTPTGGQTQATFCNYAKANNTNLGWNIIGFYQREFVNALYIMKYGNPNCQTTIGRGFVDGNSAAHATGGTNSYTNASWGETTGKYQCKLFGLEDRWGNLRDWTGGMYTDSNKVFRTQLSGYSGVIGGGVSTGTTISINSGCISNIAGNNNAMFTPIGTVVNSDYNTYYCDGAGTVYASCLDCDGGNWANGSFAGAFNSSFAYPASMSAAFIGSRLMYL